MEFNYDLLKESIGFPKFVEESILDIKDDICFKRLIFNYKDAYYEVLDYQMPTSNHNDYESFFKSTDNIVNCIEVEKVEISAFEWVRISEDDLQNQIKQMQKEISDELSMMTVMELGRIENTFGNKHKNMTVREVCNKDRQYVEWIKDNPSSYSSINEKTISRERSRLALILYLDSTDLLPNLTL